MAKLAQKTTLVSVTLVAAIWQSQYLAAEPMPKPAKRRPATEAGDRKDTVSWPEFRGVGRSGISEETGLMKRWPEGGPEVQWKFDGCGFGYSGVAIADGRIYTAGDFDDNEFVIALDPGGELLWKSPNGASWTGSTPGSRTTPTYDNGFVYHMNPTGRLAAFRADTGKEIWAVDLKQRFGAQFGTWAMAENIVIHDDKVLCLPGGTKALAAALDKRTGKTIWATPSIDDKAAYGSPVVGRYKGTDMMITLTYEGAVCINVADGELLWSHPFRRLAVSQNATTPIFHDGYVFITCGHLTGGQMLKINDDLHGVTKVWYMREFDNCHGGVILLDGRLFGCGCRLGGKGFHCVDFLTGKTIATNNTVGKVSITYADGMLYALEHKGTMNLMRVDGEQIEVVSQFRVPRDARGLYLSHPVICGGRLYLRHDTHLYCYDIRASR
jgi:outer membrane protein assembly factor BamB